MRDKISQGAEAKVFDTGDSIVKERFSKDYRHEKIDSDLRVKRTRQEKRILNKLDALGFSSPEIVSVDEDTGVLEMEKIDGVVLKDVFDDDFKSFSEEIGEKIAFLHENDVIHHDLTTSNMIVYEDEVYFIDFGLGFISKRDEDRAVDLHLLNDALESKHHTVFPECMDIVLETYKNNYEDSDSVLERYKEVKKRGRYKGK